MPRTINGRKVATEQELLDFANAIRKAGGANVIEALLPSKTSDPKSCLIANALNFNCYVDSLSLADTKLFASGQSRLFASGQSRWFMYLSENMSIERARDIAKAVPGIRLRHIDDGFGTSLAFSLPEHIGNAAAAFDSGDAFQEYDKYRGD